VSHSTVQVGDRLVYDTIRYNTECLMWTDDVVSFKRQTDLRMRKFSAFNHSACNRVLNLLEAIYLRHFRRL